jgi:hypothetical protein
LSQRHACRGSTAKAPSLHRARFGMKTRHLGAIGGCEARKLGWGRRSAGRV